MRISLFLQLDISHYDWSMNTKRPLQRLECELCHKFFSLKDFPEHNNVCQDLQAAASGPSFGGPDASTGPLMLSEEMAEEIDALRSILDEDFDYIEEEGLLAMTVSTERTHVKVLVRYSVDYPATAPRLAIKRLDNNISKECAAQMYQRLKVAADELAKLRSVFIFELFNTAKSFLEGTIVTGSSLHDEFLRERQQKQTLKATAKERAVQPVRRPLIDLTKVPNEVDFTEMVKLEHQRFIDEEKDSYGHAVQASPLAMSRSGTHSSSTGIMSDDAFEESDGDESDEARQTLPKRGDTSAEEHSAASSTSSDSQEQSETESDRDAATSESDDADGTSYPYVRAALGREGHRPMGVCRINLKYTIVHLTHEVPRSIAPFWSFFQPAQPGRCPVWFSICRPASTFIFILPPVWLCLFTVERQSSTGKAYTTVPSILEQ